MPTPCWCLWQSPTGLIPPCNTSIVNLEVNTSPFVKFGCSWIHPPVNVGQWSFIGLIFISLGEPVLRDMNTISPIYLLISPQKLLLVFQHCRGVGKLITQKQEKPVSEFRYFSSWEKEQIFSLSEQVELKSCRSQVYLYLQNSLCTLPKVTYVPIMWVLRWCSVRGQGINSMDRKGITLQSSFSGEWSSLFYSSRQCDPVQKWGPADSLYLFCESRNDFPNVSKL